jgi:competence protein CoiA
MALCVGAVALAVATELHYILTPSPPRTHSRAVRHRLRNYKVGRPGWEEGSFINLKMKFAIVDNRRTEATKGARGFCPNCNSELIAKCGEIKIDHWAHKGNRNCDPWWEPETEWHRSWKNNYSQDWQEISLLDKITNEKHIADIWTNHGLVIEFQHSYINPQERISREKFYKNMVWVVDGTRRKNDYSRFVKGKNDLRKTNNPKISWVHFPDECFHSAWIESSVLVIFDFMGNATIDDRKDLRNLLYCLVPKKNGQPALLVALSRQDFINSTIDGELLSIIKQ